MKLSRFQVAALILALGLAGWPLGRVVRTLRITRGAVQVYARIIASANVQDLATIRALCTSRYLADQPLRPAQAGGVVGFPRQIHPNYRAWVAGDQVWLCPGNRVGLVVRFVREAGQWRYDGEVGLLRADGQILQTAASGSGPSAKKPEVVSGR